MKLQLTELEQAFLDDFNTKVANLIILKNLAELNLLSANGIIYRTALETYITTNQDQWVELQTANNP